MVWHKVPYTNFHDINMDFILDQIRKFGHSLKDLDSKIDKVYDGVKDEVNKLINQYIQDGTLYVAMEYVDETEELNIILTRGDDNG